MSMTRLQFLRVAAIMLTGVIITSLLGYGHWGSGAQAAVGMGVIVLSTFGSPRTFGWRD